MSCPNLKCPIYRSALAAFIFLFFLGTGCSKTFGLKSPASSPTAVFNDLWDFMDKHYALFEVKQKDWNSLYQHYATLVNDSMNESELFEICADMLEELQDGHVSLEAPFRTSTYDNFYKLYPVNFNYPVIEKNYLKNNLKRSGPFVYASDQGIGYIYYGSFNEDYSGNQIETVFNDLQNSKGLIIDVRNNSGGRLANVNRLTQKLLGSRQLIKYELHKKGPGHNDFEDPVAYFINPDSKTYDRPIVLLTNRKCFSACNDFASYVSVLANVTIVGDQTGGGGSIPNSYILVNGWKLQYSSTITWSASKLPIDQGIQPDYRINISPIEEANGLDPILEKAVSLLR